MAQKHLSKTIFLLLIIDILVMSLVFSMSGFFNTRIDTAIYVSQIEDFEQELFFSPPDMETARRAFKPFYAIVGSWLVPLLSPHGAIFLINVLFLFSLTILAYFLFRELIPSNKFALGGAIWVATGYPMLKYGLALGTDISGWFFAAATVLAVLVGSRTNKLRFFILASLLGFIGILTKESGALGLLFGGIYILTHIGIWDIKKIIKALSYLSAPFLVLEGLFVFLLYKMNLPTFFEWYGDHLAPTYIEKYYKMFYFVGTEMSTFNILLLFSLIGIYYAVKNKDIKNRQWVSRFISLLIASLPILAWPMFISRILYIQFLFFIPLGLYGIYHLSLRWENKKIFSLPISTLLICLPIIASVTLYLISGNGSLFDLIKNLY